MSYSKDKELIFMMNRDVFYSLLILIISAKKKRGETRGVNFNLLDIYVFERDI
jgi:hypothetical protein